MVSKRTRIERIPSICPGRPAGGVAGGATYDAEIAASARAAGAQRLLTLNARHFERLGSEGLEIVDPSAPDRPPGARG